MISINPDDALTYYNLGQALLRQHEPIRAFDAVEAADYFKRARDLAKAQGNLQLFEKISQFLPEQAGLLNVEQVRSAPFVREGDERAYRVQERRHRTDNRQQGSPTSPARSHLAPLVLVISVVVLLFCGSYLLSTSTKQQPTQPPTQTAPKF